MVETTGRKFEEERIPEAETLILEPERKRQLLL
jgi:hypothetical protein